MDTIHIARDRKTGFPCVRRGDSGPFVSFFPVTKLQVEQWIWEGGGESRGDPNEVTKMIERLELSGDLREFPSSVSRMKRIPISKCSRATMAAIPATNLELWTPKEEVQNPRIKFPTPGSEWGSIVRWLGGEIPSSHDWEDTLEDFSAIPTAAILREILKPGIPWTSMVGHLLQRYLEMLTDRDAGLPFMNSGVHELISEIRKYDKITIGQSVYRPQLAGESTLWPTLEMPDSEKWRSALQPSLPVVTIRLLYDEDNVTDHRSDAQNPFFSMFRQPSTVEDEKDRLPPIGLKKNFPSGIYVTDRVTMRNRCPRDYMYVDPDKFNAPAPLWCYTKIVRPEVGEVITTVMHENTMPAKTDGILLPNGVSREYLVMARKKPSKIRPVCLSGYAKAGKGTWLLSLAGMLVYPQGNPSFLNAFPDEWKFGQIMCLLDDFLRADAPVNIYKQMENMWIDGDVPERTPDMQRALSCPIYFKVDRTGVIPVQRRRDVILIFNDIAGEIITKEERLANNPSFPHVSASTDVLFLIPANEISNSSIFFDGFATALGKISDGNESLDLEELNLILAISKIDLLKHGTDADKQLLQIFLQQPCGFPERHSEAELASYITAMEEIDYRLHQWFSNKARFITNIAERFGSVRYCGFSAFGFEPIQKVTKVGSKPMGIKPILPFIPQPVRVVDPVLWLLRNNGLIRF